MKAAVLAAPTVSSKTIEQFRLSSSVELIPTINSLPDVALVFGGDGTVHRFLPEILAHKIPMLVVPKGTGNDFAHVIGIHSERVSLQAWKDFCSGANNLREIDLGIIHKDGEQIPFCCVVGAGMDADANARANRLPRWLRSSAGYLVSAVQALFSFKPVDVHVTTETRTEKRPALLIAIGNAHRYGGGIKIVPRAKVDDGLLDICLVGRISRLKVLFCLPIIYFGGHTRLKEVQYFQDRSVRIDSDPPLDLYADGELACRTPVEITLLPKALKVIVPANGVRLKP